MPIRRANWYNLHSTRRYPLDDNATGTDDNGVWLHDDIIVDCHIRFPKTVGQYAFLSGLTITETLVTAVILASDTPTAVSGYVPIASVSLQKPVDEDIHYPISPLADGVGGWIVFGDVSENFVGRFATPIQGLIAPKCARPYEPLPIPTLRKLGRDVGLEGIVLLKAGNDIEIIRDTRFIEELQEERDAIVIRLLQPAGGTDVLSEYIGPCDGRPESRNCLKEGIEAINEAIPDCDGNLTIRFDNLLDAPFSSCGGTTIDHDINIEEACAARDPEKFAGQDYCVPSESSSSSVSSEPIPSEESSESSESSEAPQPGPPCLTVPYCVNFSEPPWRYLTPEFGTWQYADFDSPEESCPSISEWSEVASYRSSCSSDSSDSSSECWQVPIYVPFSEQLAQSLQATNLSRRNLCLLDYECEHDDDATIDKVVTADMRLGSNRGDANMGLLINYHTVEPLVNPREEYFYASLDRKKRRLTLWFSPGQGPLIEVVSTRLDNNVVVGDWYRMKVTTQDHPSMDGRVIISVSATGVTDPSWAPAYVSSSTNQYETPDGYFGMMTKRANAYFSFIEVVDR